MICYVHNITIFFKGVRIVIEDSKTLSLPCTNFRDIKYLQNVKQGDEIIYITDDIGIKEVFLPIYEMNFEI